MMWTGYHISGVGTSDFITGGLAVWSGGLVWLGVQAFALSSNIAHCFPICLCKFRVQPSEKLRNVIQFCLSFSYGSLAEC